MTMLLLHLSDVHLDGKSSSFLDSAKLIVSAALSPLLKYSHVHIVWTGDLANRDAAKDFEIVRRFVDEVSKAVTNRIGLVPTVVLAPGNHDMDFSGDQSVRDILVSSLRQSAGRVSPGVVAQIGLPLEPFRALQADLMPGLLPDGPWYATFTPDDSSGLSYIILNSALTSMKKEEIGKLYFPIESVTRIPEGRTIVVMHHPLGWFMPDNAREIAQRMPHLGQLVLMGHEHVSVGHLLRDIYDDSSAYYMKANVLKEEYESSESAFLTLEIDLELGFTPRSYKWNGSAYAPWIERTHEGVVQWPAESASRKLTLTQEGLRVLRSPGANYSHRRKANITLEDIFVWPNLRRLKEDRDVSISGVDQLYDSRRLAESSSALPPIIVIRGGEQSGKSTLAQMLALQLGKRGGSPLLMVAASVSSWREKSLNGRLVEAVDQFYGKASREEFQRVDPKDRALIIDDFDLSQVAQGYFDGLRLLRQQFGRIYLMLDSHPGMEIALSEFLKDENFVDSEIFDLVPSTQAHRLEIIEKWLGIGVPEDIDLASTKLMAAKFLKVVDETLGRNLIPSLPVFVLIVLQRAETEQDLETVVKSGSQGFLYESMIRQALSSKVNEAGLVTSLAYLTAFAGACDSLELDGLSTAQFERFHNEHCEKYELIISKDKLLRQLEAGDLLDSRTGIVRFRYPFHYYYFLAKWLWGIGDWSELEPRIDQMVESIYTEKNANVLLFLAHLGRNPRIQEKILASAQAMFLKYGEGVDVFQPLDVITNARPQDIRAVMLEGKRHEQLEDRGLDEKRDEVAAKELTAAAETRLKDRLEDALRMNAAFKTLQVLGQVLRNHAGEIPKPEKQEMAETCVKLGLRVLKFIFDTVSENEATLISFRADQIRAIWRASVAEKNLSVPPKEPTDLELADELTKYLPSFVASVTVGTMLKIANAIGCEDLDPTLESVLQNGGTRQLIKIATKLEHFSEFPTQEVLDFNDKFLQQSEILPNLVLRRFLIRRFHLFPVRDELKKQLLAKFDISPKPFKFLPQRGPT